MNVYILYCLDLFNLLVSVNIIFQYATLILLYFYYEFELEIIAFYQVL